MRLGLVAATYLGGRLVLGTGSSWPQDFLFLAGFLSSDLESSIFTSGLSSEVSAGETVMGGISGPGVEGRESVDEKVSSMMLSDFMNRRMM